MERRADECTRLKPILRSLDDRRVSKATSLFILPLPLLSVKCDNGTLSRDNGKDGGNSDNNGSDNRTMTTERVEMAYHCSQKQRDRQVRLEA